MTTDRRYSWTSFWPGLVLWAGCLEGCWLLLVLLRSLARVGVGREPAQRAVGVFLIVAVEPGGDEFAGVVDVVEHCVVEELVAHTIVQGSR